MEIRKEVQQNAVAGEVPAITAVVRPILGALLYSLKSEVVNDYGGYQNVLLRQLSRNRAKHDGESGVCFEYAVHDAIINNDPMVLDRIDTALKRHCKIAGGDVNSLLFGVEKTGKINLIESVRDNLTNDSRLLAGSRGQPIKLKKRVDQLAAAFRKASERKNLPTSISGLWKADLFVGRPSTDQWVGTTVKINQRHLEAARGLRLAIVPADQGKSDTVRLEETKNLIVVPVPYDGAFMEVFWCAWETVLQVLAADCRVPKPANLPRPAQREVARLLADRREFSVLEVIEALDPLSQPYLLQTRPEQLELDLFRSGLDTQVNSLVSPFARRTDGE
ncbi:hypothetical protein [Tropicimonas sediminicola]|uniref:Uncharacterized protein n=1 Tax=Tropicimonas sediminicola TaxID=1031541 RepID=A0A239CR31_9RHOB|nr:hypothetical protein [Tropicimonas sediminicola]SNS21954.1 hypothetical protein SAMN05421757_101401 [Tropicimonas sediminicola]